MKHGSKVKVHYTGTLNDGTVFDSSEGKEPLEFTIGEGRVIPGFENGVKDIKLNEERSPPVYLHIGSCQKPYRPWAIEP